MASTDEDAIENENLVCFKCGYPLSHITAASTCPECGTLVADSFKQSFLNFVDAHQLPQFRRGTAWMAWSALFYGFSPFGYGLLGLLLIGAVGVIENLGLKNAAQYSAQIYFVSTLIFFALLPTLLWHGGLIKMLKHCHQEIYHNCLNIKVIAIMTAAIQITSILVLIVIAWFTKEEFIALCWHVMNGEVSTANGKYRLAIAITYSILLLSQCVGIWNSSRWFNFLFQQQIKKARSTTWVIRILSVLIATRLIAMMAMIFGANSYVGFCLSLIWLISLGIWFVAYFELNTLFLRMKNKDFLEGSIRQAHRSFQLTQ